MKILSLLFSFWFWIKTRFTVWNLSLFLVALIPRLFWAFDHHPPPFSDMEDYYLCAINALRGGYLAMAEDRLAYRSPGYPLFLLILFTLFPADRLFVVRLAQSVLDACSVLILFAIANHVLQSLHIMQSNQNKRLQFLLAYLLSLHYSLLSEPVFFSSILMTETLYTFLLLCWIWFLLPKTNSFTFFHLIAASILLGLMALVRPISLCFLPVLVFRTLISASQMSWKKKVLFPLTVWMIPILPWTIRNFILLGSMVLLSTNSGVNFYIGHHRDFSYYYTGEKEKIRVELMEKSGRIDEVLEDRYFFQKGLDEIVENPHLLIKHSLQKLYYLYVEDEKPWPLLEYGDGLGPGFYRYAPYVELSWHPFLLLLSLAGMMYAVIKKLPQGVLLSVLILYTAACLIYFARTRFRLPIEPLLIFYAWLGIVSIVETLYSLFWRWKQRWIKLNHKEENPFHQVKLRQ